MRITTPNPVFADFLEVLYANRIKHFAGTFTSLHKGKFFFGIGHNKVDYIFLLRIYELDNPFDVEADEGVAAEGGFQEEEVLGVIVEEIFAEGAGAEGVFEEGEAGFEVWVVVCVVAAELVTGEVEGGGLVEAGGEAVTGGLASGGVAGPAAGGHPLAAVSGGVGVDGDQADVVFA